MKQRHLEMLKKWSFHLGCFDIFCLFPLKSWDHWKASLQLLHFEAIVFLFLAFIPEANTLKDRNESIGLFIFLCCLRHQLSRIKLFFPSLKKNEEILRVSNLLNSNSSISIDMGVFCIHKPSDGFLTIAYQFLMLNPLHTTW